MSRKPRWEQEQLEMLLSMCADMPWAMVVAEYNKWASLRGFPSRSSGAMIRQCERHGLSRRCSGQWVTSAFVSQLMGVTQQTVCRWTKKGKVRSRSYAAKGTRYISRAHIKKLANEEPSLFNGLDACSLTQLFDDQFFAEKFHSNEHKSADSRITALSV